MGKVGGCLLSILLAALASKTVAVLAATAAAFSFPSSRRHCRGGATWAVSPTTKRQMTRSIMASRLVTPCFSRKMQLLAVSTINNEKESDDDDDTVDVVMDSVSDAEALLACRSYLQRRNRLGEWTESEKRKEVRSNNMQQSLSTASSSSSSTQYGDVGFFWHDPSELKYLYKNDNVPLNLPAFSADGSSSSSSNSSEPLITMTGGFEDDDTLIEEDDEEDEDENDDSASWDSTRPSSPLLFWEDDDDDDLVLGETSQDFAAFDGTPTEEHVRRSSAAKRVWSDPKWRAQWYEKRWGRTGRHLSMQQRNDLRKRRKLEQRLRALDPDQFLGSEALADMTQEEIAHAIQEYVASNRKRGQTRAKTRQARRQQATINITNFPSNNGHQGKHVPTRLEEETAVINTNSSSTTCKLSRSLEPDSSDLAKAFQERSKRAAKAYQTRLENQRVKGAAPVVEGDRAAAAFSSSSTTRLWKPRIKATTKRKGSKKKKKQMSSMISPRDALRQVERDLEEGFLPDVTHVQAIVQPKRLAGRKEVLLRILNDCFVLRGKCIPANLPTASTSNAAPADPPPTKRKKTKRRKSKKKKSSTERAPKDKTKKETVSSDKDDETLLFATTAPLRDLGDFVVWKLQEQHSGSRESS